MNDNILKGFIEVLIPITLCNLKCHYCYVIQRNNRTNDSGLVNHSPEEIARALSKKRLGGTYYISICGAGETMLTKNLPAIVKGLLEEGHIVNITTNGTVTKAFDEFISTIPSELMPRLNFSFSLHYIELKRLNLLDRFWGNINRIKDYGASFIVQINLCDEYLPYWEEIKKMCIEHVGAPPQVAATRKENNLENDVELYTDLSRKEYEKRGNEYDSELFRFTMKNFMVKRTEFCYAGKWTFVLNLQTGIIRPCYASLVHKNIYKNIDKPIDFHPIGNNCQSPFCMNSSHFIALGAIPAYINAPTYSELRNRVIGNRGGWQTPIFQHITGQKLYHNNSLYYSVIGVWAQAFENKILRLTMKYMPKYIIKNLKRCYKKQN